MPSASAKKLLAISPYFPPANTPDMQRLRMALPYFSESGWEVTVAAAADDRHSAPRDPLLLRTVPVGTRVVYPRTWNEASCRRFGFGHLSYRVAWPWRGEMLRLLREEKFDLVFFTTTQTMVLANGPFWQRKTGVPYVIDIQDPIYIPGGVYNRENAPGAFWKYKMSLQLSRLIEKTAFSRVSGVVSTSEHYLEVLRDRYPSLRDVPMETLPFAVPEQDLALLDSPEVRNGIFMRGSDEKIVLYAGRGGPDLHPAMRAIFRAAASLKESDPEAVRGLRLYFVGTSYGPAGAPRQVAPIAEECGCGDVVVDEPERRPYFEVLKASQEADAVLVLGSRSADYTASKALLSLAASRRVIAVVHRDSLVFRLFKDHPQVSMCSFQDAPEEKSCMDAIVEALRTEAAGMGALMGKPTLPAEYTARAMTGKLCGLFDLAVSGKAKG